MKRFILYTLVAFTLPSCGGTDGRFRLEGEFEHLRQGEFYIYSNDGGAAALDTIKLEDGRFDYETELKGQATYYLLYPNLSEQVIFGASGDVLEVKGDARNLKSVEVKGSEPNEQLTAFRLENMDKGTAELRKAAADFIAQSPASPVSVFLFKTYFLQADDVPQGEVRKHYRALCKAQPDNLQLLGWQADVEALGKVLAKGSKLPAFRFKSRNGEEVCDSDFQGKPLLVNFWASWENRSAGDMFRIKRLLRDNKEKIQGVSISLDVEDKGIKSIERRDTVWWPSYCDYQGWNGALVKQFAVRSIPYYILAGADGKVIAAGASYDKDIMPELDKLLETK